MLQSTYYLAFLFYGVTFLFRILGSKKGELPFSTGALLLNGIALVLICLRSGYLPLFNIFESFLLTTFILGCLGFYSLLRRDPLKNARTWIWLEILILFGITLFFQKQPSARQYDHGYLYIVLFYLFRVVSFALVLNSTALFIEFRNRRKTEGNANANGIYHMGRNFLLLSALFFLMGEYVGIVWSQEGWGDFWHWNATFFQSTVIVVYFMITFHIPGKGRRAEDIRAFVGGMGSFVILTLTILRSFY